MTQRRRKVSIAKGNNKRGSRGRRYNKVHDSNELPPNNDKQFDNAASASGSNKRKKKKKNFATKNYNDDDALRKMIEGPDNEREIIEMQADGNCLFRAISHHFYRDFGQRHDQVRHEICNFLEENEEDFSIFLLLDDDEEDVREFDSYVTEMRQEGTWGGDVEIVCAARLYSRNITIFSSSGAYNIGVGDGVRPLGPDLLLSYHENSHYNSVYVRTRASDTCNTQSQLQSASDTSHDNPKKQDANKNNNVTKVGRMGKNRKMQRGRQKEDHIMCSDDENEGSLKQALKASAQSSTSDAKRNLQIESQKRNDKCACGSGLRYKKCCLAAEKSRLRLQKLREKHGLGNTNTGNNDDGKSIVREVDKLGDGFNILTI